MNPLQSTVLQGCEMFYWTARLNGEANRDCKRAAVAVNDKLYSFGRYNRDQFDVHIFNTVSLRWRRLPPVTSGRGERPLDVSSSCWGHTAVLIEDIVYIWGGYNHATREYYNELYAFDVDAHRWFQPRISGAVPEGRYHHSACVLRRVMYVHGGYNLLNGHTNDVYKLDTAAMVWSLIDAGAPESSFHSATVIGTKMFVFGGRGLRRDHYNNVRVFDTETNCWLSSTPSAQLLPAAPGDQLLAAQLLPEGRRLHSAFAYNGALYIFGGESLDHGSFNDLWKFNPETFSWKEVKPKGEGPLWMTCECCCMVGERIIIFGVYLRYTGHILDLSPSLKTLCKLATLQYGLEQSELTHDIRWELAAMTDRTRRPGVKVGRNGLELPSAKRVCGGEEGGERSQST